MYVLVAANSSPRAHVVLLARLVLSAFIRRSLHANALYMTLH